MNRLACAFALAFSACTYETRLVSCGELLCPANTVCTAGGCANADSAAACETKIDGDECSTPSIGEGTCNGGSCHPVGCGNGIRDRVEACDDGNQLAGDLCSPDCKSTEQCGNAIVDVLTEECDRGIAGLSGDGCTSRCTFEIDLWRDMSPRPIGRRSNMAMAYDADRGVTVLFGGGDGATLHNDTWEWDGTSWIRRAPPISPPPLGNPHLVYDGARKRILLVGGNSAGLLQIWEWDGITWLERTPTVSPPTRGLAGLAYDANRERVVLFGGGGLADTWEWDGTTWVQIAATSPFGPRNDVAMAYDPVNRRVVIFGGYIGGGVTNSETWAWTGSMWVQHAIAGPSPRHGAEMVTDTAQNRVVLFGGYSVPNYVTGSWSFDGNAWTQLSGAPPSRLQHGMAYDAGRDRVVVYGGFGPSTQGSDTWELGGVWSQRTVPVAPTTRQDHALAYDSRRGRVVLFGGETGSFPPTYLADSLWEWDGLNWRIAPSGPSPRAAHAIAYDEHTGKTIVFGGITNGDVLLDDTWTWDGVAWMQLASAMAPAARHHHAMAYDVHRRRLVLFGGRTTGPVADTWEWDGAMWTRMSPAIVPPARSGHVLVYDRARERVVLFGGTAATFLADTWEWDGTTWSERAPTQSPPARAFAHAAYDPLRRTVVLSGGGNATERFAGTWEWDGTSWRLHSPALEPPPRTRSALAYDAIRRRAVVFSGSGLGVTSDVWTRGFESAGFPPERCAFADEDSDGDGLVGCDDPDCFGRCSPLCPPELACEPDAPRCGDGVCSLVEDSRICPNDCPAP